MSNEPTLVDLMVALARLESKTDTVMKQLDELSKVSDQHWKRINDIENKLARLEERQGPKIHWITWIIGFVALFSALTVLINYVAN